MSAKNRDLCVICVHTTERWDFEGKTYRFCPFCGLIQLDPQFQPSFDEAKERYLLHNNNLESAGYVRMLSNFISENVEPFTREGARVLDFGSGPEPVLAQLLERQDFIVDVFDIHFAPQTPYRERTYDIVTATEVLEHLDDPASTLRELSQVLAPGGIISIMTRFHNEDRESFKPWRYRQDITHISFFSERTMKHLAGMLDLKILLMDEMDRCVLGKKPDTVDKTSGRL